MEKKIINKLILSSYAIALLGLSPVSIMANVNDCQVTQSAFTNYPVNKNFDSELSVDNSGTHFSLWSPGAEEARVLIYENQLVKTPLLTLQMKPNAKTGTWSASDSNALYGKYYTFQIKFKGKWLAETPGVWAKAVGVNGTRAAIIDFAKTNPEGWDKDTYVTLKNPNDAILYEMHNRDFSMHQNSGITNKGKFVAMLENGTLSVNGEKTGIDHLKELGITHVHILPSYDYNSVDESNLPSNGYNWGYDPLNYNAPEGSYSTNPANPATRIFEMKEMIQALHNAGIGVVMDVVYNHTAQNDESNFSLTAPGYYYRQRTDGSYSDASACGNETASDREMVRDFIVNSVKYWTKEYHIDGYRFDLMAIHDIETMNQVAKEVKAINPNAIIYGEGWTAGDSPLPVEKRALKVNVAKMNGVAVFSDDIRDGVKGHYSEAKDRGFATGKAGTEETVKMGIVASTAHPQVDFAKCNNAKVPYAKSPLEIINYVSCHDDLTLTDKLAASMPGSSIDDRVRAAKLAQTIVFTSQGTPFMFAGEEIFRDKKGVHNSFKSPDSINAIDWNQKKEYRELFDYYRALISLRKAHPAFRMTTAEDIAKNLVFDKVKTPLLISYSLKNNANGDSWKEIKVIFNGADTPQQIKIAKGKWKIIAQDGKINPDGLGETAGGMLTVPARSALILAIE